MFAVISSLISGNRRPTLSGDNTMGAKSKDKPKGYTHAFMEPSSIHPIHSGANNILTVDLDQNIAEISRKIVETGKLPTLQVVEKSGNWFTLNNAQLDLCRSLQKDGRCSKVKVDIVPLSSVPCVLRGMMVMPGDIDISKQDPSRTTTKGYERLDQIDGAEDAETDPPSDMESDEEDDTCSESSDYVDSESEYDWSDEDQESSEVESSESDEEHSTDDERECLL